MICIRDIKLPAGAGRPEMMDAIVKEMCLDMIYPGNSYPDFSYELLRRSIDARKKPDIFLVYTVKLLIGEEDEKRILGYYRKCGRKGRIRKALDKIFTDPQPAYEIPGCGSIPLHERPLVVGTGPAGLFCALLLARRGFAPIVVERGQCMEERTQSIGKFWSGEALDPESNVQFGEGGAGTFSDGKLNTLTKDTNGRNTFVIRTFYEHGAPEEILYDARPHIGTDILKSVVVSVREEIKSLGGTFYFDTKLSDIVCGSGRIERAELTDLKTGEKRTVPVSVCVLCTGHSARDTFEMLYSHGMDISRKSFAVGFRVIHPQSVVDGWQYGAGHDEIGLPPADYKVAYETSDHRRVYSFCMCPGGYVVNASSEEGMLCVNGMSEYKRDSGYANSAVIVAVSPDDFMQDEVSNDHPLAGMYYQRHLEAEAYRRGMGDIPVQRFCDFAENRGVVDNTFPPAAKGKVRAADLRGILSPGLDEAIIESMHKFGYTRKEFDGDGVLMLGIESRTSSPIRMERGEDLESDIKGLYPCGEGAGYAGGITSAAADGIRCAEKIIRKYYPEEKRG